MSSKSYQIRRAVRLAFAAVAVSGAAASVQAAETQIAEVIVTGSRIASASLDSPSPMQIVSAEDINSSGVPNIQDLLLKSPVFGTPGVSRTNSNFLVASSGVATID